MEYKIALKTQLSNLVKLQSVDIQIDAIKKKQSHLPEHLNEVRKQVQQIQLQVQDLDKALTEKQTVVQQIQSALFLNKERQQRAQVKLTAVSNTQEYEAIQKEMDQLKKLSVSLELQEQEGVEGKKAESEKKQLLEEKIADLSKSFQQEHNVVSGQSDDFQKDINELIAQRDAFLSQIERPVLSQYLRVRASKKGIAVVSVVSGQCKGCNMMVPAQMYIEILKASHLHSCPTCKRLFFVQEESAKQ